jgi:hypothetical protein
VSKQISQYFNQTGARNEQRLVEDLIVESIQINGLSIFYIPRTLVKEDPVFGEDPLSKFEKTFKIEAYFDSPQGFEGQKDSLAKFGIELRDEANFIVSRRRFTQAVQYDGYNAIPKTTYTARSHYQLTANEVRPLEGDLIYLPLTNDLFIIKKTDHESVFHQLGGLYIWRILVQKFDYSAEPITTGVQEIDRLQQLFDNAPTSADSGFDPHTFEVDPLHNDPIADNTTIKNDATTLIDFSETNPFGEPDRN